MNDSRETIFALSSGAGRAGIAVYRLSGPLASEIVQTLCSGLPYPRRASLNGLRDPENAELIDRGLVIWTPGPNSFTGEDVAEFHIHGGLAVGARLADVLSRFPNCRPAEAGEFARRAFENGKLDLAEIEGIADLVDAETEFQRRQAVRQMAGAQSQLYESWRTQLLHALALVEAGIDFPEEDDLASHDFAGPVRGDISALVEEMSRHLDDQHRGERLRGGVQVVIAGPPNAGKSTLLNALSRRDAAIVSTVAGTTRDIIRVDLDLGGYPVTLIDTAGLRQSSDEIEQEGVRRAVSAIEQADIVLYLFDAQSPAERLPGEVTSVPTCLLIRSKYDEISKKSPGGIVGGKNSESLDLSVHRDWNIDALETWLCDRAASLCGIGDGQGITRARHRDALQATWESLRAFLDSKEQPAEISAENLRQSANHLGRITGRVDVEDLLDIVFSQLCIGK
jgi:tRNA modification GTPase